MLELSSLGGKMFSETHIMFIDKPGFRLAKSSCDPFLQYLWRLSGSEIEYEASKSVDVKLLKMATLKLNIVCHLISYDVHIQYSLSKSESWPHYRCEHWNPISQRSWGLASSLLCGIFMHIPPSGAHEDRKKILAHHIGFHRKLCNVGSYHFMLYFCVILLCLAQKKSQHLCGKASWDVENLPISSEKHGFFTSIFVSPRVHSPWISHLTRKEYGGVLKYNATP